MVRVRFNDQDNLTSCANFLAHRFPGDVKKAGETLDLAIRVDSLPQAVQERIVERLLWAWRRSHQISDDDGFVLSVDRDKTS